MIRKLIKSSKEYAIRCHRSTNHRYGDDEPYEVHLKIVVKTAKAFKHLIPERDYYNVISACWCHDVIEDCRQTYNDVRAASNTDVAEIVYALTTEKGRNRKERANDKYYLGIRLTEYAVFVKLCDRIANVKYSKDKGSRMFDLYGKENKDFVYKIQDERYVEMFDFLQKLLDIKDTNIV